MPCTASAFSQSALLLMAEDRCPATTAFAPFHNSCVTGSDPLLVAPSPISDHLKPAMIIIMATYCEPPLSYHSFIMKSNNSFISSGSYAMISSSGISPFEKIFAIETYWLSLDFRFSLSPSPVINSTLPLHLSTVSKNH